MEDVLQGIQVVVLMGGLGTRLGLQNTPKALADVNGTPFFDYQLSILRRWRFRKFLFLTGYCGNQIEEYYGDGRRHGVDIDYSSDGAMQRGTGGALKNALPKLDDYFLLLYGDSFLDIDYQEVVYRFLEEQNVNPSIQALMTVYHNDNQLDRSNVVYEDGELVLYDKNNQVPHMEYIDYGVSVIKKEMVLQMSDVENCDLSDSLRNLSIHGRLMGLPVYKRFYEIGTTKSLDEFANYAKWRFKMVHKAVFLDRDGVINELVFCDETEQIDSPFSTEDWIYKDGIVDLMKLLQAKGYLLFVMTNQPSAAKGYRKLRAIYDLNHWMEKDLEEKGVHIECVNICPHHPEGSVNSRLSFLVYDCDCRKPKAGLITDLCKIYNLDKNRSFVIGDSYTDMIAGREAGVKTIFSGKTKCDNCQYLQENRPDYLATSMQQLTEIIANA